MKYTVHIRLPAAVLCQQTLHVTFDLINIHSMLSTKFNMGYSWYVLLHARQNNYN